MAVGIGGFLGSCLRFCIAKGVPVFSGGAPFGTLLLNVAAGIAVGVIIGLGRRAVACGMAAVNLLFKKAQ